MFIANLCDYIGVESIGCTISDDDVSVVKFIVHWEVMKLCLEIEKVKGVLTVTVKFKGESEHAGFQWTRN